MAIQVSIDGKTGDEHGIGHAAATWAVIMIDGLGRALAWIFERLQSVRGSEGKRKQMQLVESLMLGNRRQLLLVACGDQRYLVGAGADSVGSILAIGPDVVAGEGMVPVTRARHRSTGRIEKGPELVRHKIVSDHEAGSGLWP